MVVDDEEFCIATMRAMLEKLDIDIQYQVDFCIDGNESLEQLKKAYNMGMSYKIIFTDFSMPNMNGIESTKKMRKFLYEMKVPKSEQPTIIGVTGHILDDYRIEGENAGMELIVPKPLYLKDFKLYLRKYGIL
jgi:two-component system sensor histidine kinase/response regulator